MNICLVPHVGNAYGHFVRALELAESLERVGHKVEVIASEAAVAFATRYNLRLPSKCLRWKWGHNQLPLNGGLQYFLEVRYTARALSEELIARRPDLVIGIPGVFSAAVCHSLGIPHLSVLHGPWLAPLLKCDEFDTAASTAIDFMKTVLEGPVTRLLCEVTSELNGRPLVYEEYLSGSNIRIAHLFPRGLLTRQMTMVPFIAGRYGSGSWEADLARDRTCCVTFGSAIVSDITEIVCSAADAFDSVIVVRSVSRIGIVPSNVLVVDTLPAPTMAAGAQYAICHGGIGTIGTFQAYGCTQLLIPGDIDQTINAALALKNGSASTLGIDQWITRRQLGRNMPSVESSTLRRAIFGLSKHAMLAPDTSALSGADVIARSL